jgi:hypothetical protein
MEELFQLLTNGAPSSPPRKRGREQTDFAARADPISPEYAPV